MHVVRAGAIDECVGAILRVEKVAEVDQPAGVDSGLVVADIPFDKQALGDKNECPAAICLMVDIIQITVFTKP